MFEQMCVDAKVIDEPIYTPATIKTTMRCLFNISTIVNRKEEQFTLIAEGSLADICACHLSEDRKVNCMYVLYNDELILKDIILGPGPNISINTKTKKYIGGDTFGFAKVKQ